MPIEIQLSFVSEHRSIKALPDTTLPNLSVISGPNGCGKTQLLEAINSGTILATDTSGTKLSSKIFQSTPELNASHVTHAILQENQNTALDTKGLIENLEKCLTTGLQTHILLNGRWKPITRETLMKAIIECLDGNQNLRFKTGNSDEFNAALKSEPDQENGQRSRWEGFKKFVPLKVVASLNEFNESDIKAAIYDFVQYQTFMQVDASVIFYRYFEEFTNNAYKRAIKVGGLTKKQFVKKFGVPPWDEVNCLLESHGFRHRFLPPSLEEDSKATNGYTATLVNSNNESINTSELSSGEKVIIALLLSAYAAQQKERKLFQVDVPDLILFDELDAHLHPSMTRMMFDVLQKSIIEKLSCRIIITTHSPSTVALSPLGSIFKLTSGATHNLVLVDAPTACRDLSDGFIQLMDGSQIVIVEGKDDPLFYRAVERALRSNGHLTGIPTLHFIPASQTNNPSNGGGADAAEDWANKLKDAQLPNIHALLDNDGHRTGNGAIKVLGGRYAIENFVLDPLSLAVALITDQRLVQIDNSLATRFTQTSSISSASTADLQDLVDQICAYIESHTPCLSSTTKISVNYLFGQTLNLPDWICKRRGKDLVGIIREAFKHINSNYIITRKDSGEYDLGLGYLLKLWSQHPDLFPCELSTTLNLLRP